MKNPWENIDLIAYETHMSSDNVLQLQILNNITKEQLNDYKNTDVTILGIAGGNGLENIDISRTKKVYGIDVNKKYLVICKDRYSDLTTIFDQILPIHHDINADELLNAFKKADFKCMKEMVYPLPNGKEFIRMDFKNEHSDQ